jgi:glycine cleavage system H protein
MSDLKFTTEHEWVRVEGETAKIGISTHAAEELGEIVYVELPAVGTSFEAAAEFGTVESVKTLSSLYMPVSGEVLAVNAEAVQNPALLNDNTEGAWLIQVKLANPSEVDSLMDRDAYQSFLDNA